MSSSPPVDTETQELLLKRAHRRALHYGISRAALRDSITQIEPVTETYHRVLHRLESRRARLAFEPGHGTRKSQMEPMPALPSDPWAREPALVTAGSRCVAQCPRCDGEKKTRCAICRGGGRVTCWQCNGVKRVRGQRGYKNCPKCRGRGDIKCKDCRAGKVACGLCDKVGRVFAWVEIDREQRSVIKTSPQNAASSLHEALDQAWNFDADPATLPAALITDARLGPGAALPTMSLAPELDPRTDRLLETRLQSFEGRSYRLHYELPTGSGVIELSGRDPQVAGSSDWSPFRRRLGLAWLGAGIVLVLMLVMAMVYAFRHEWFLLYGSPGRVFCFGVSAAIATLPALLGLLLSHRARALIRSGIPTGLAVGFALASTTVFALSAPSGEGAQAALAGGDLERARIEAEALRDLEIDAPAAARVLDGVLLTQVRAATTVEEHARLVGERWSSAEVRSEAIATLCRSISAEAAADEAARSLPSLLRLRQWAGSCEPAVGQELSRRIATLELEACEQRRDFACVERGLSDAPGLGVPSTVIDGVRDRSLGAMRSELGTEIDDELSWTAKVGILTRRLELAQRVERIAGMPSDPSAHTLERQLTQARHHAEQEEQREQARREREQQRALAIQQQEQRRAAREAAREERRRQQQARPRSRRRGGGGGGSRLLCCDGTLSPSCRCAGSHRGCCSHHGGVCGCGG